MKLEKIFFTLSIIGILILIFLSQTTIPTYTGTIESIQSSNNKIIIQLENHTTELILFDTSYVNLSEGDKIEFQGRHDTYKNQEQIIIHRLYKK
jgi:DNA/RNA endonuclease YhcR with UshA esterase domain